jgi:uncharacterized protein YkwD
VPSAGKVRRAVSSIVAGLTLLLLGFSFGPTAAALACADEYGKPSPAGEERHARAVRCVLNQERRRHGLGLLRHDENLARAARRFSGAMVRGGFFGHTSPGGSTMVNRIREAGYRARTLGETIAWGSGSRATPAAIVRGWLNSPGHRAIILDGSFDEVGLGVAIGSPFGHGSSATVTADFGRS